MKYTVYCEIVHFLDKKLLIDITRGMSVLTQ